MRQAAGVTAAGIGAANAPQAALLHGAPPPVFERGDGALEIAFDGRPGGLVHLYQRAPARALLPKVPAGQPSEAVLITTSGGLTGGDRMRYRVRVSGGGRALVTTQAAEKIYRSLGPEVDIGVELEVAAGARLEWLPQETILFDGARLARRTRAVLEPDARLLACEMLVFGRTASGERFRRGSLAERWRLERGGRLMWADALGLEGDVAATLDDPFTFAGAAALATLIHAAPDAARHLALAREAAAGLGCRAGASLVNGILLGRLFGPDAALVRAGLADLLGRLRRAASYGHSLPRVW